MAVTYQSIDGAFVGTSVAALYASPSGSTARTRIEKLVFTNHTSSPTDISVYVVPEGDTAGTVNIVRQDKTLTAGESYTCVEAMGMILASGATLQAVAGAASAVTATGSVVEIT